jgi:hypothetical protein
VGRLDRTRRRWDRVPSDAALRRELLLAAADPDGDGDLEGDGGGEEAGAGMGGGVAG